MSGSRCVEAMQRAPRCGQLLEHRLGERRAVVGIGAGAELVEQDDQRAVVHALEHVAELLDERGEGREVLRHALVVADDGEAPARRRAGARRLGGHVQTRLRHQREQGQGLERHRLAARVGPGDDEQRPRAVELDVDGHDGCGRAPSRAWASSSGLRAARRTTTRSSLTRGSVAAIRSPSSARAKMRSSCAMPASSVVELGQRLPHRVGQRGEDAEDLALLLADGLHQFVVRLHHAFRLDEERGAALRSVVDDAAQAALRPRARRAARSGRGGP